MCHVPPSVTNVPRASKPCRCATCLCSTMEHVLISAMDAFETGYAMGLIVGEGSFTADRQQPYLQVKLHARDPFPLRFLADALGGRVYGPYRHQNRHYFSWLLRGPDLRNAIPLLRDKLPESWKREQFENWLNKHQQFFAREPASGPQNPSSQKET